jgi:hypothetical protein
VLDHVFTDAIGALRDALESALLERHAFEEHFSADVLLGDLTWSTSYTLPGEGLPPRVQAEITLGWPTWSQTAWRNWYIGEDFDEPPRIEVEVVIRVQRLSSPPDPLVLLGKLPALGASLGPHHLERSAPTVETAHRLTSGPLAAGDESLLGEPEHAIEVSYEGLYEFDEEVLADGSLLDGHFAAMGGWVSATLVAVGDLPWNFLPPADEISRDE